ncbi:hypothetical protein [Streptomyces griseus]|uniref:hypothetical protein n=1 Tax=Streptomyces griseus TaxID=1911 RepID=UPI0036BFA8F3
MSEMAVEKPTVRTVAEVLKDLDPNALVLLQKVIDLENENIHIRDSVKIIPGIVDAVKGLTK